MPVRGEEGRDLDSVVEGVFGGSMDGWWWYGGGGR